MRCQGETKFDLNNCITCEGKQFRLPFKNVGKRASYPLEVIHTDLCGPMQKRSLGGSKYFLTFLDDYSRMGFIYFLKSKDELFEHFKNFKSMVEKHKHASIKYLGSDNGGEYCSKNFENYLKQNGIILMYSDVSCLMTTNSYTPQQNGLSERLNRTLVEKARCMLYDANLGTVFWAKALNCAMYLRIRSVASGIGKTPFEMWYGVKPNLEHLIIFGSRAMMHIDKNLRKKWDKKAKEMIFIGYDTQTKGYRLYDPEKREVKINRDVILMEETRKYSEDKKCIEVLVENESSESEEQDSVGVESALINDSDSETEISDSELEEDYVPEDETLEDVPAEENVRKSCRKKIPKNYDDFVTYMISHKIVRRPDDDPITVEEALSRPDSTMWRQAIDEELASFDENDAWELVNPPGDLSTIVPCKWVFKKKGNCESEVRYRAIGFVQEPGGL